MGTPDLTPLEAAEILKVLEKVSFCDTAHEAYACRYPETGCSDCEWQIAKNKIQNVFRAISAGEYKRMVHANWEQKDCNKWPVCSNCGKPALSRGYCPVHSSYCPSCGAPMDEKGNSHA